MFMKSIKIEGFKNIHELSIEFDRHFNVIVGENGTGKSTVFDAICLALGTDTTSIRVRELSDLIPMGKQTSASFTTSVTLVLSDEVDCTDYVIHCHCTSGLNTSSRREYKLANKAITASALREWLYSKGLPLKPSSYMISQDSVVTLRNSKEIGEAILQASGARDFLNKVETLQNELPIWTQQLEIVDSNLQHVQQLTKKYKVFLSLHQELSDAQVELEKEAKFLSQLRSLRNQFKLKELLQLKNDLQLKMENSKARKDFLNTEINKLKKDYEKIQAKISEDLVVKNDLQIRVDEVEQEIKIEEAKIQIKSGHVAVLRWNCERLIIIEGNLIAMKRLEDHFGLMQHHNNERITDTLMQEKKHDKEKILLLSKKLNTTLIPSMMEELNEMEHRQRSLRDQQSEFNQNRLSQTKIIENSFHSIKSALRCSLSLAQDGVYQLIDIIEISHTLNSDQLRAVAGIICPLILDVLIVERLDVVSKVLKLAEKERIRVLIWALEKLREDEVLIKRVHQAGIVRKILYETDWCKKSEEKLSLDFKPQLLIDCLSVIDSSLPSDISLVLIKLCKVWVLAPNDEIASVIVKELKLNVITPSGNRHLVGALQSIGRNNARSKYEEILKAKILKQIGFNDIQKINREMKRIDEVLNLYGARIINLRRKIIEQRVADDEVKLQLTSLLFFTKFIEDMEANNLNELRLKMLESQNEKMELIDSCRILLNHLDVEMVMSDDIVNRVLNVSAPFITFMENELQHDHRSYDKINSMKAQMKQQQNQLNDSKSTLKSLDHEKQGIDHQIKEIRKEIYEFEIDPKELKNVTKQIEELCVEVSMCEMPKTKIDNENIEEFRNVKEIEKKIHQIKEKQFKLQAKVDGIQSRLENVPEDVFTIIEDVVKTNENLEEFERQRKVIEESIEQLKRGVDQTQKIMFYSNDLCYKTIDHYLKIFFHRFFPNREVHLFAIDPMNLSLGVEIKWREKDQWKSVNEFSGGQISLLGLSLCNPSFLYLLDEIDAALDERSTQCLASLLQAFDQHYPISSINPHKVSTFNNRHQIVCVSHRPAFQEIATRKIILRKGENGRTVIGL